MGQVHTEAGVVECRIHLRYQPNQALLCYPLAGHRKTDPFAQGAPAFLHSLAIQWASAMCQALLSALRIEQLTRQLQSICDGQNNGGRWVPPCKMGE